jgi:hypothetical protein
VVGGDQLAHHLLAFPHRDQVHEGRHRLRVGERADAAHEDHGVAGSAVGRARGNPGHPEETDDVQVVTLVGHGEADQVELTEGPEGLERERRGLRAQLLVEVFGVGKEHALADHVRQGVEMGVDGLEAQIGHAHRVGIGIDERDGEPPAAILAAGSLLGREERLSFSLQGPGHTPRVSPNP